MEETKFFTKKPEGKIPLSDTWRNSAKMVPIVAGLGVWTVLLTSGQELVTGNL